MTVKEQRKRKRMIQSAVRAFVCVVVLTLVLAVLALLTSVVKNSIKPNENPVIAEEVITEQPKQEEEKPALFSVCIDAGHGGKDNGADRNGRYERNDNLQIALAVKEYLESQNVRVVMTREDDTFLKLSERCRIANGENVDYMISLHRNTGDGNGVETWLSSNASPESVSLADHIMGNIVNVGVSRNRGISYGTMESKKEDYYINKASNAPAMILELGFLNSSEDNQLFDEHLNDYAKAIGDGIITTYDEFHGSNVQDTQDTQDTQSTSESENAE